MAGTLQGPGAYITNASATAAKIKGKVSWYAQKAGEGGINLPGTQHPENGLDASEIAKMTATMGMPPWLWTKHEADPAATRDAYTRTLQLAKDNSAAGVIFSVETPDELKAAMETAGHTSIPKAIALSGKMLTSEAAANIPAEWQKLIFVDNMSSLAADDVTPEQLAKIIKENPGIVTVLPSHGQEQPPMEAPPGEVYQTGTPIDISKYLAVLQGNSNVAVSHYEDATATAEKALSGRSAASSVPQKEQGGGGSSGSGGGGGHSSADPKKVEKQTQVKKSAGPDKGPGIAGPHQAAGTDGAPKAYTGGGWVVDDPKNKNDTFSFTNKQGKRVTITTTSTGAKVEQVEGQTPYQIQKPQTPAPPPKNPDMPAWHQDPNWKAPTAQQASQGVLEQKAGANGNTVFRMSDGTYTVNTPDGASHPGGTWDKSQWPDTGVAGLGADTNTQQ